MTIRLILVKPLLALLLTLSLSGCNNQKQTNTRLYLEGQYAVLSSDSIYKEVVLDSAYSYSFVDGFGKIVLPQTVFISGDSICFINYNEVDDSTIGYGKVLTSNNKGLWYYFEVFEKDTLYSVLEKMEITNPNPKSFDIRGHNGNYSEEYARRRDSFIEEHMNNLIDYSQDKKE